MWKKVFRIFCPPKPYPFLDGVKKISRSNFSSWNAFWTILNGFRFFSKFPLLNRDLKKFRNLVFHPKIRLKNSKSIPKKEFIFSNFLYSLRRDWGCGQEEANCVLEDFCRPAPKFLSTRVGEFSPVCGPKAPKGGISHAEGTRFTKNHYIYQK